MNLGLDSHHSLSSLVTPKVLRDPIPLNTQIKEECIEEQRDNLFHIRCHVQGKACSMIVDGRSCTNAVSTFLINRLGLSTIPHPRPYKLQWLNDYGKVKVNRQSIISFSISKYYDEQLCDIVPMHAW